MSHIVFALCGARMPLREARESSPRFLHEFEFEWAEYGFDHELPAEPLATIQFCKPYRFVGGNKVVCDKPWEPLGAFLDIQQHQKRPRSVPKETFTPPSTPPPGNGDEDPEWVTGSKKFQARFGPPGAGGRRSPADRGR